MDYTTATRTFNGNNALDGYAGFRRRQTYTIRYCTEEDGTLKVALDHVGQPEREATFSWVEFREWWVKG